MKPIKEIMTLNPQSCLKNETLLSVSNQMSKFNIGALPVVDESKKVIGIITDRDIVLALCKIKKTLKQITVNEAMTSEVYTIDVEDDAANALNLMREKKIGRLPIVNRQNCLEGMISFNSISRKIYKEDIEKAGKENVLNTLQEINDRNETITK